MLLRIHNETMAFVLFVCFHVFHYFAYDSVVYDSVKTRLTESEVEAEEENLVLRHRHCFIPRLLLATPTIWFLLSEGLLPTPSV